MRKTLGAAVTVLALLSVTAAQAVSYDVKLPSSPATQDTSSTVKDAVLPKGDGETAPTQSPQPAPPEALTQPDGKCPSIISGPGAWFTCKLKEVASFLIMGVQTAIIAIIAVFVGAFFPAIERLFSAAQPLAPMVLKPWVYSLILGGAVFALGLLVDGYRFFNPNAERAFTARQIWERTRLHILGLVLGAASLFLVDYFVAFQNDVWSRLIVQANPGQWPSGPDGAPPKWLFARVLAPEASALLSATDNPSLAALVTSTTFYGGDLTADNWLAFGTGNGLILTVVLQALLIWLGIIGLIRSLALPVLAIMGPVYCMGAALWPSRDPIVGYASMLIRAVFVQSVVGIGFALLSLARPSPIFSALSTGLLTVVLFYVVCSISWRTFAGPVLAAVRDADFTLGGARVTDGIGRLGERAGRFLSALGVVRGDPALAARGARLQGISQALRMGAAERAEAVRAARQAARPTGGGAEEGAGSSPAAAVRSLLARQQEDKPVLSAAGEAVSADAGGGGQDVSAEYPDAFDLARDPVEFIRYKATGRIGQVVLKQVVQSRAGSAARKLHEQAAAALHPVSRRAEEIQARLASPVRYSMVQSGGRDPFGRELTRVMLPSDTKAAEDICARLGDRLASPATARPGGVVTVFGDEKEVTKLVSEAEAPHRPRLARKVFAWRAPDGRLVINEGGVPLRVTRSELPVAEEDLDIVGEWGEP